MKIPKIKDKSLSLGKRKKLYNQNRNKTPKIVNKIQREIWDVQVKGQAPKISDLNTVLPFHQRGSSFYIHYTLVNPHNNLQKHLMTTFFSRWEDRLTDLPIITQQTNGCPQLKLRSNSRSSNLNTTQCCLMLKGDEGKILGDEAEMGHWLPAWMQREELQGWMTDGWIHR